MQPSQIGENNKADSMQGGPYQDTSHGGSRGLSKQVSMGITRVAIWAIEVTKQPFFWKVSICRYLHLRVYETALKTGTAHCSRSKRA